MKLGRMKRLESYEAGKIEGEKVRRFGG